MADAVLLTSLAARWVAGWLLGGRLPTLASAVPAADARCEASATQAQSADKRDTISVIIPARNEAHSISALLDSLSKQTSAAAEVIVVDDDSTDGTAEAAARAGARVLRAPALPAGWIGKPWACAHGAAAASGGVLVFLDADTILSPEFLRRLGVLVDDTRGLVSVAPFHVMQRPYEWASALFNLIATMGAGASSLLPRTRITGAFGPCLAMRTEEYAVTGGHGAVRGEVLDDVALARACMNHGLPVRVVAGGSELRYRMYPDGFAQLVEGWSKNFAAGAGSTPLPRLLAIVAWVSGLIEAGVLTTVGMARWSVGGPGPSWPHALFYGLFAFQLWFLLRRLGSGSAVVAIAHPVAALIFLAVCARSAVQHLRGEVTWKGRTIAVRSRRRPRP